MPYEGRRSTLPYVKNGRSGYKTRKASKGEELTFGYHRGATVEFSLVGSDPATDFWLKMKQLSTHGYITLNLTLMREDELDALLKVITTSIELARDVVKARDEAANNAFQQGDDRDPRLHREASRVSFRDRALVEYLASLPRGLEPVPGVEASGDGDAGEPGGSGVSPDAVALGHDRQSSPGHRPTEDGEQ